MVLLAAACAAAAVSWWSLPRPAVIRLRRVLPSGLTSRPRLAANLVRNIENRRVRRRRIRLRRAAVIELCDGIGAELAAGRSPESALTAAAAVLDSAVAAELLGTGLSSDADVPAVLLRSSTLPGAEGLRLLAACWRIGAERGGTFAPVVDGLAAALRDEEAQREEISSQLAGPRATARLLAGLPVLGLAMGAALGAHPLSFLSGTLPGLVCLVLGVGLDALGLWWTNRLSAAAERPA